LHRDSRSGLLNHDDLRLLLDLLVIREVRVIVIGKSAEEDRRNKIVLAVSVTSEIVAEAPADRSQMRVVEAQSRDPVFIIKAKRVCERTSVGPYAAVWSKLDH